MSKLDVTSSRKVHEIALMGIMEILGNEEIEVLHDLAVRIATGQGVYGKLNLKSEQRDLDKEAYEEDLDSSIYRSCRYVKRKRAETGP